MSTALFLMKIFIENLLIKEKDKNLYSFAL